MASLLIYRGGQYVPASVTELQAALAAMGAATAGHTHAELMTTGERAKLGALPDAASLSTTMAGKADLGSDGKLKASQIPASALVDVSATGMTISGGVLTLRQDGGPDVVVDLNAFATDAEVSAALAGLATPAQIADAIAAHGALADPHPGKYAAPSHTHDAGSISGLGPLATMTIAQAQASVSGYGDETTKINNAIISSYAAGKLNKSVQGALSSWFAGPIDGGNIFLVGDSTTLQLFTGGTISTGGPASVAAPARYGAVGGELPGVTMHNYGANGNTLENFNNNLPSGLGVDSLVAALQSIPGKKLVIWSYGINSVRSGANTVSSLVALARIALDKIIGVPGVDVVLRMPNSFLTTNVGGRNYVTPNGSAQYYSNILRDAYRALDGVYPNAVLYDSQKNVFNEVSPALSANMADQIHPSTRAYFIMLDQMVQGVFGATAQRAYRQGQYALAQVNVMRNAFAQSFNFGASLEAIESAGYRLAPTVYPQVVLNGDYDLIVAGYANGVVTAGQVSLVIAQFQQGGVYSAPALAAGTLRADDVVVQLTSAGVVACLLATAGSPAGGTVNTTALSLTNAFSASAPYALTAQAANQPILVYRNRYGNGANIKALLTQLQYRAQALFQVSGTPTADTITLVKTLPGLQRDVQWTPRPGDVLAFQDIPNVTLTSAMSLSMNSSGALITINQPGAGFATSGTYIGIAGVGPSRAESNLAQPMCLNIDGPVGAATINRYYSRSGRFVNMTAFLDTPDATNATTVSVRTMLNGALNLVATITFAAGSNVGTVAYLYENNIPVAAGVRVAFVIAPGGAGVAGLHIAFDQ